MHMLKTPVTFPLSRLSLAIALVPITFPVFAQDTLLRPVVVEAQAEEAPLLGATDSRCRNDSVSAPGHQ